MQAVTKRRVPIAAISAEVLLPILKGEKVTVVARSPVRRSTLNP